MDGHPSLSCAGWIDIILNERDFSATLIALENKFIG